MPTAVEETTEPAVAVSIVMPCHNAAPFLAATIESVQAQSFAGWELLIVDDRSHDDSRAIAGRYAASDARIRCFALEVRSGPALARNHGIERARGRYVALIDSDDVWKPEKLARQLAFMRAQDAAMSYTAFEKIDHEGARIGGVIHVRERVSYHDILDTNDIKTSSFVFDTDKLGKNYVPDFGMREDFIFFLALLKKTPWAHGLDEPLIQYRIWPHSRSRNKLRAARFQWRVYREVEKLPLLQSLRHFAIYARHGYRKLHA